MKNLLLILGAPGVGKTTTCAELKNILPDNIFIDADSLLDSTPFIYNQETREIFYKNIVYVLNNFITHTGLRNIIHCWIVPEENVLQDILSKLNLEGVNLFIFALTCTEQAHLDRIKNDTNPRRANTKIGRSLERLATYKTVKIKILDTSNMTSKAVAELIKTDVSKTNR